MRKLLNVAERLLGLIDVEVVEEALPEWISVDMENVVRGLREAVE